TASSTSPCNQAGASTRPACRPASISCGHGNSRTCRKAARYGCSRWISPAPFFGVFSTTAPGLCQRGVRRECEMFEVGFCRHVGLAAGGQPADALPILTGAVEIAFEPADVAAFEKARHRIRRLSERPLDIDERRIEAAE